MTADVVLRSLRDARGRRAILDRLAALTPGHTRRWGRMEAEQLLPHLASGLRLVRPGGEPSPIRSPIRHFDHHLRQFGV